VLGGRNLMSHKRKASPRPAGFIAKNVDEKINDIAPVVDRLGMLRRFIGGQGPCTTRSKKARWTSSA
jgi:hypothetical protein